MSGLTDKEIRNAKLGDKLSGALGGGLPGRLVLRARPSGKEFSFRYRVAGQDRMIVIGPYSSNGEVGTFTLARAHGEARKLAERLRSTPDLKQALERDARARKDEIERQEQARRQAEARSRQTLRALLDVYIGYLHRRGKTGSARDVASIFGRHVCAAFPHLADLPAAEIHARDVAAMVRALVEKQKDRTAGKLRSYLAAAYALALRAETDPKAPADALAFRLPANPAQATKAHSGVRQRDRVLSETELRHYMRRVAEIASDVQRDALMLLLLLGGQRPAQLLRVAVADVDQAAGTLLLRDPKGKREQPRLHKLPLCSGAQEIVARRIAAAETLHEARPENESEVGQLGAMLLFTTHGVAPVRLETLSVRVSEIAAAMLKAKEARAPFQLRDLRRTAETMLAAAGISRDVRAQLLSHGISGVQSAHYDRHDYMAEKGNALLAWESRLHAIATNTPAASNVRRLKRV